MKMLKKSVAHQRHLVQVMLDQLKTIQMIPLQLPNPRIPGRAASPKCYSRTPVTALRSRSFASAQGPAKEPWSDCSVLR